MKTLKQYREEKNKPETMETSFGSHSQPKTETMETSFGSHSEPKDKKEKLSEDYKSLFDKPTTLSGKPKPTLYDKHIPSATEDAHIHEKVAPFDKDKMSGMERESVDDYTDESRSVNSMLHRHSKGHDISTSNSTAYRKTVKHLDNLLGRRKTTEDMHVYTGIKYSPAKHFKKVDGKVPESKVVNLPAFTSTSSSVKCARPFSSETMHPNDERHGITYPESGEVRHILKIHVPKGSSAMSLKAASFCPEEKEVVLHRGHDIEIHHKPEQLDKDTYLWHAKVVGHKVADLDKEAE